MNEQFDGNGIFPKGEKNEAYAQYFQGTSYLNMLSTEGVNIGNVVFEPGCRNHWHIHHAKRGGGRVAAKPHIAAAEQRGNEKLVTTIEQKLKGG